MKQTHTTVPEAVAHALRLLVEHPHVNGVDHATQSEEGDVTVALRVRVELPFGWQAKGCSPTGVRTEEPAQLIFPRWFPVQPPRFLLRTDFNRNLPHIDPGPPTDPVRPCLYEGGNEALFFRVGLLGMLDQLVTWLDRAARPDALIDPEQGWEPVRRDFLASRLTIDTHAFASLDQRGGQRRYTLHYRAHWTTRVNVLVGEIGDTVALNSEAARHHFKTLPGPQDWCFGRSIAYVIWPPKHAIADTYLPETVVDIEGLQTRAAAYGCASGLEGVFRELARIVPHEKTYPVAIVLCARRPFHLIGTDREVELCPYVFEYTGGRAPAKSDRVLAAGHHDAITVPLLQRMGGPMFAVRRWTLIGAGSLGSKIAIHLARRGLAPCTVVDRRPLAPHNAARHALLPTDATTWSLQEKAGALTDAIRALGQEVESVPIDAVLATRETEAAKQAFRRDTWAALNTTADPALTAALASTPDRLHVPRVVDAWLMANGAVSVLTCEGPDRSPNIGDLTAEAYSLLRHHPAATILFGNHAVPTGIGQGCSSDTLLMSDAIVSMHAAPMSETLARWMRDDLPATGEILIGTIGADGLSVAWEHRPVPTPHCTIAQGAGAEVRISARAHEQMEADKACWSGREAGGVLLGRYSTAAKTFYVTDTLEAPPDSKRTPTEFILGTDGLTTRIEAFRKSCNETLYVLGTWHAHLAPQGPSPTDRETAMKLAASRPTRMLVLVSRPDGYQGVVVNPSDPLGSSAKVT